LIVNLFCFVLAYRLSQKLLLIVVIFALLSITQAELGSALAYRKNYLISHSL
jgi:hypothetical protein